jgi:hypothetical protein
MGEPYVLKVRNPIIGRTPAELKYLSKQGKEINRDSESSDERNRNSLNSYGAKDKTVAIWELHDVSSGILYTDNSYSRQENNLKRLAKEGYSPVSEIDE